MSSLISTILGSLIPLILEMIHGALFGVTAA